MRAALITLGPTLAAAALVLLGGERLAREESAMRRPADRDRLIDFASALEAELERLESLYLAHLSHLARWRSSEPSPEWVEYARDFGSLAAVHRLTVEGHQEEQSLLPVGSTQRLPEVSLAGVDRPLNPHNAVIVPVSALRSEPLGASGWLTAPNPGHRVFWTKIDRENVIAFVVSWQVLHTQLHDHLQRWLDAPLAPLRESGERIHVEGPLRDTLVVAGGDDRGPTALLMPLRTSLGDWHLQAWDGVEIATEHRLVTLVLAGSLAAAFVLSGVFLFVQQRRALRLAEERVSFVNRVSHELGAPLTNLSLNIDLAAKAVETSPAQATHRLAIVTEEIERLARLVANVLTFSRRERGVIEIDSKPCNPDEVISRTLDSFRPSLERRQIEIVQKTDATRTILLDPDALEQIVGNLLSNVEKYASSGRWLEVCSASEGDELVITISDHGPGIPARSRLKVFEPFERVHKNVNEGASGTGLGLTIARDLADRMGGSLRLLESDVGTRFQLRLPATSNLELVEPDATSAA